MKPAKHLSAAFMSATALGLLLGLTGSVAAADPDQVARGAKEWADNCGRCHNLRSPDELSPEEWKVSVSHMHVRANIPGNVADDIIAFLQASSGVGTPSRMSGRARGGMTALRAGDAARGEQVYMGTCVSCHGADGKGVLQGVPDFASRLGKSDNVLLSHIMEGYSSPGSHMAMPPRGGNPNLTDQDMADALAYIRSEFGR